MINDRPDDYEIQEECDKASFAAADGKVAFPGMTYEDGVRDALDWVLGNDENPPLAEAEYDD